MALPEDELRKQLPQKNTTGSPALAGQPASITGQPAEQVPTSLPASPSGGNANVASAPLSQNGANESQGGAGDSLNLVEDRGTPIEYMQSNVNNLGSERVMEIATQSAGKAKRQATGVMRKDPDGALPQGQAPAGVGGSGSGTVTTFPEGEKPTKREIERNKQDVERISEDLGMTDDKKGEANRASIENMFGDIYENKTKMEVTAGTITEKEAMIKNKKYQGVFKGMTRHEFSMFLWDYGSSLMAHGDKGLRGAGFAGAEAMGGHLGRRKEEAEQARVDTEALRKADLDERGMKVRERSALGKDSQTIHTEKGMMERDADGNWDYIRDPDGNIVQKGFAENEYRGEKAWLAERYAAEGMDQATINELITGTKTPAERSQMLQDQLSKLKENFVAKDSNGKKYQNYTSEDDKAWIKKQLSAADEAASEYVKERATAAALSKY